MKLYLAVTADEYELPLFVTNRAQEMADKFGISKSYMLESISRSRKIGCSIKFVRIEVDD